MRPGRMRTHPSTGYQAQHLPKTVEVVTQEAIEARGS